MAEHRLLNKQLNDFANNAKQAYGGLNSVRAQIGYHLDEEYTDISEPTHLPLSNEFQQLLASFLNPQGTGNAKWAGIGRVLAQLRNSRKLYDLSERQRMEKEELDVKCLRILRCLLHNSIVRLGEDGKGKSDLGQVQTALCDLGVVETVLPHLNSPGESVPREVLSLLIALLHGGSRVVQAAVMAYFEGTKEETFFFCLQTRFAQSAAQRKELRGLRSLSSEAGRREAGQLSALLKRGSVASRASKAQAAGPKSSFRPLNLLTRPKSPKSKVAPSPLPRIEIVELEEVRADERTDDDLPLIKERHKLSPAPSPEDPAGLKAAFADGPKDQNSVDTGSVSLIVQMLGLLCDGQNATVQDYLREQRDNIKSVNLVAEHAKYLQLLYARLTEESLELATEIVETMAELASGNLKNQMVLFDHKVVDAINFVLRKKEYGSDSLIPVYRMKRAMGLLLRAMTEESTPQSRVVLGTLGRAEVEATMTAAFECLEMGDLDDEERGLVEFVGFSYAHLLSCILNLEEGAPATLESEAWTYFMSRTHCVEVLKDSLVHRLYFRVEDERVLRSWVKEKLKWEVDRSSPANKLSDFMAWCGDIRRDISYQRSVNSFAAARVLVRSFRLLSWALLLLSGGLNVAVLSYWVAPESVDPGYNYSVSAGRWEPLGNPRMDTGVFWAGLVHLAVAVLLLLSFLLAQKPSVPWRKRPQKSNGRKARASRLEVKLLGGKTIYYMLLVAMSVLGVAVSPAFFAFHLLHVAANNQLLSRVISAVTLNGRSLLMVGLLMCIVMYMYALVGFAFLRNIFTDNRLFCDSLAQCFATVIREGLLYGLTERFDMSEDSSNFTFTFYAVKMVFDVSFFIVITTIGLNIVFGIIVDTFSELRDSKWQIEKDMHSVCFICGRSASEFQHVGKDFIEHVKREHSMWSYIFLLIHLDSTPRNDLSALEMGVWGAVEAESTAWLPLGRSLGLAAAADGSAEERRLESLLSSVRTLEDRLQKDEVEKQRRAERERQRLWGAEMKDGARAQSTTGPKPNPTPPRPKPKAPSPTVEPKMEGPGTRSGTSLHLRPKKPATASSHSYPNVP